MKQTKRELKLELLSAFAESGRRYAGTRKAKAVVYVLKDLITDYIIGIFSSEEAARRWLDNEPSWSEIEKSQTVIEDWEVCD